MTRWRKAKTAPKDGIEIIVWTSTPKGFQDMTCTVYWDEHDNIWRWYDTHEAFNGTIHGWVPYPQPVGPRPDGFDNLKELLTKPSILEKHDN